MFPEFPTFSTPEFSLVLPIRTVFFQVLFLFMAIALESYVLQKSLGIAPKRSVEYATVINLLSTVIGWIVFFNSQTLLPGMLKLELIGGIFFDQWSRSLAAWIVVAALITFFMSFFVKLVGFQAMQGFLGDRPFNQFFSFKVKDTANLTDGEPEPVFRKPASNRKIAPQVNAILVANAVSYSAISLVLFLRILVQQ